MTTLVPEHDGRAMPAPAATAALHGARRGGVEGGGTVAVLAWVVIAGTALVAGSLTVRLWPDAGLRAAPLYGYWDWQLGGAVIPAAALGVLAVVYGPRLAAGLSWGTLVLASGAATIAWSVALAATDGWSRVAAPLSNKHDYLRVVDRIVGPGDFLRTYTDRLIDYPIHVKGHPPGMPLLLWALDRLGLGGTGWAAAVVLAGAGLATGATLVALRAVTGEAAARRAAPFVAIAPAALWLATSADALFAGIGILGCACLVAGRRPAGHLAGGVLLGVTLHLTYGAVVLLVIPVVVAGWRRDLRPLGRAAVGVAAVGAAFALAGFWWFDGLDATRHYYEIGVAADRPYPVFVGIVNPGVVALATGPAVAAGLWRLARPPHLPRGTGTGIGDGDGGRGGHDLSLALGTAAQLAHATTPAAASSLPVTSPRASAARGGQLPGGRSADQRLRRIGDTWRRVASPQVAVAVLPLAGLGAVVLANLSGMSKGEVERIWLPFYPWLLTATAALPHRQARTWLAAQVALTVLLEVSLRSAW